MSIAEKLTTIAENTPKIFNAGYEKGKAETVDYMPFVKTIIFGSTFSEMTNPVVLDLVKAENLSSLFNRIKINCPKITIKISEKCTNLANSFINSTGVCKEIEFIGTTINVNSWYGTFGYASFIENITGELDFTNATDVTLTFAGCSALKNVFPKKETIKLSISFSSSPDLTDETIQAIIDGLAVLTGQEAQTVTFHADVKAKLTDEQISTITSKNWTLA